MIPIWVPMSIRFFILCVYGLSSCRYLDEELPSMRDFGSFIFTNPSYFCMWNKVSGNKAHLALFTETKLHMQKCYTCRDIDIQSHAICYLSMVQYRSTASLTRTEWLTVVSWFNVSFPLNVFPDTNFGPGYYIKKDNSFHRKLWSLLF